MGLGEACCLRLESLKSKVVQDGIFDHIFRRPGDNRCVFIGNVTRTIFK